MVSGRRPPGDASKRAPISESGSITRPIGRFDSDASPVKVAVIVWLAITPISSRVDVPELPMSSAVCGCRSPPTPTPFRSEEHTSELQSLMRISYAVFCLKKKKKTSRPNIHDTHTQIYQILD